MLWQESVPLLAVAARETSKIKLGHFVTNPATRDPTVLASAYATLHDLSDGRMAMGIGRGDSAVRYIGRQPMKVAEFEQACAMVREFMNGREVNWNDKDLQLKWVREELPEIPMWIAGYGPKALAVAGRVADGVIIQLADPEIITWIMDTARKAAEEAGPRPGALKCIVGAPSHVTDDLADARDQVRWFPAMVSNHVMDLIERYGTDGSSVPKALTDYVQARKFYDYNDHSRVGAAHGEFVTDEICDRFCVIGNTDQIKAKLKELEDVGVDQFNVYLMTHGQEETLQAYGDEIIPEFSGVAAVRARPARAARDAAGGAALVLARRRAPARRVEPPGDASALRAAGARWRARAADGLRGAGLRPLPAGRARARGDRRGRQRADAAVRARRRRRSSRSSSIRASSTGRRTSAGTCSRTRRTAATASTSTSSARDLETRRGARRSSSAATAASSRSRPDGPRVAVEKVGEQSGDGDIYICNVADGRGRAS